METALVRNLFHLAQEDNGWYRNASFNELKDSGFSSKPHIHKRFTEYTECLGILRLT